MSEKKLGFGLMRLPLLDPNDSGSLNYPDIEKMVDAFIDRGFTYFDTAYMYCNHQSEPLVKEVLTKRYPRECFTITSKLPSHHLKDKSDRDRILNEQLSKTGLDYFDYYLLHGVSGNNLQIFEEFDCFTWIKQMKAEGKVRKIGFSFHDGPELLDRLLTEHPEFDVVQLQINYLDWENDSVQSRACYEVARKHQKPIIIMEPVKGGTLANVPQEVEAMFRSREPDMSVASWAVRFAAGLDGVMMVLSGMSNMEQLLDNTGYMAPFRPLSSEENRLVLMAADMIRGNSPSACTGCAYCTEPCPMNIAIPQYFSLYNRVIQTGGDGTSEYAALAAEFAKASDCAGCGRCEAVCPQKLPIRQLLCAAAKKFEG